MQKSVQTNKNATTKNSTFNEYDHFSYYIEHINSSFFYCKETT